jgi:hypothetical protein
MLTVTSKKSKATSSGTLQKHREAIPYFPLLPHYGWHRQAGSGDGRVVLGHHS